MQQSQRRAETLAPIRTRVHSVLSSRCDDQTALIIALVSAMREGEDVVHFMFPRHMAIPAHTHRVALAITEEEWEVVFGRESTPLKEVDVNTIVASTECTRSMTLVNEALRCTISEQEQSRLWARPWTRALCLLAMHMENPHGVIELALGNIVRADHRRLEELRESLDDNGIETMLMSKLIMALVNSVL